MKLLFFTADGCGPCRQMAPVIFELTDQDFFKKNYSLSSINIDTDPETSVRWGVRAVPTFIILDEEGGEVSRHVGVWPGSKMQEWMVDNLK